MKTAPKSVIELHVEANRRDARMRSFVDHGGAIDFDGDYSVAKRACFRGRVALPAPLLQHAHLSKDIVIAGLQDRLEIWDREAWRRQLAEVEGSAESVAERLAQPKS